ncbi:iron chelate uptake ABC transporter family permease subunit [Erysipelothrix anatis]|uniref:iron chelate uptake ABC transporter family permease subunit n=1 Tax=Erysipelothrix anatis TaxID=2683713 RepID=UPI0013599A00|nr:iron chelate uptake ABC transporter family permease subunit [Erysipelothrix anatis]
MKRRYEWLIIAVMLSLVYFFWGMNSNNYQYLMYRRSTRLLAMWFVSLLTTTATTYFQVTTNNRILTPSLLGFERMYILVQTVIVFLLGIFMKPSLNFLVSVFVMVCIGTLFYGIILKKMQRDLFVLLLVGTVLGTLFSSISATMQMMMDPNEFSMIQSQSFASFNAVDTNVLIIGMGLSLVGWFLVYRIHHQIDVVALGNDHATNLGVHIPQFQIYSLAIVALFTAISTALVGPIGFLGLIGTNVAREFLQKHTTRSIITQGVFFSTSLLLASQLLFERLLNLNTSVTVFINLLGGVYFIYLMLRERFK